MQNMPGTVLTFLFLGSLRLSGFPFSFPVMLFLDGRDRLDDTKFRIVIPVIVILVIVCLVGLVSICNRVSETCVIESIHCAIEYVNHLHMFLPSLSLVSPLSEKFTASSQTFARRFTSCCTEKINDTIDPSRCMQSSTTSYNRMFQQSLLTRSNEVILAIVNEHEIGLIYHRVVSKTELSQTGGIENRDFHVPPPS